MSLFSIIIFVFIFVSCQSGLKDIGIKLKDRCGDIKYQRYPIMNGEPSFDPELVDLTEAEVMAIGAVVQKIAGDWVNVCTATLIEDRVVLTAAHCTIDPWTKETISPELIAFVVGDDIISYDYWFEVKEVYSHPDYDFESARWDVGILILKESSKEALGDRIKPLPINSSPLPSSFLNSKVQNVGYGMTDPNFGYNTKRWWTVEEVIEITEYDFTVSGGGKSSVCIGDSGGPSLWTFPDGVVRIVGTVSWGELDCVSEDHFARTDFYYSWVSQFLNRDSIEDEEFNKKEKEVKDCDRIGYLGRCEENIVIWCENNILKKRDCNKCGQVCTWINDTIGYYCKDNE